MVRLLLDLKYSMLTIFHKPLSIYPITESTIRLISDIGDWFIMNNVTSK